MDKLSKQTHIRSRRKTKYFKSEIELETVVRLSVYEDNKLPKALSLSLAYCVTEFGLRLQRLER